MIKKRSKTTIDILDTLRRFISFDQENKRGYTKKKKFSTISLEFPFDPIWESATKGLFSMASLGMSDDEEEQTRTLLKGDQLLLKNNPHLLPVKPHVITAQDYTKEELLPNVLEVAKKGCAFQIRRWGQAYGEVVDDGKFTQDLFERMNSDAELFINNDPMLANELGASVVLGPSDYQPDKVRHTFRDISRIIWTVYNKKQLSWAKEKLGPSDLVALQVHYAGRTKVKYQHPWGLKGVKCASKQTSHPIVLIGGLKTEEAIREAILAAGGTACEIAACLPFFNRGTEEDSKRIARLFEVISEYGWDPSLFNQQPSRMQ